MTSKETREDIRLKYRYLDLRNAKVRDTIIFRSQVIGFLRQKMTEMGFLEIQTPILCASSPEGARDYIVPSRKYKGKFYALPQAPQQYKQLLMVSGFDKYFQIAPCFRDEDARADRSPGEFYQLDFEMSFATQEDVFRVGEEVLSAVFERFAPEGYTVTKAPYPIFSYKQAMLEFGTDKPDLRNPLRIIDVTDFFQQCTFKPFIGRTVRAINVHAEMSKGFHEKLLDFATSLGMGGLGYLEVSEDMSYKGPIDKFIPEDLKPQLAKQAGLKHGDTIFFIADKEERANYYAGKLRVEIGNRLELCEKMHIVSAMSTIFLCLNGIRKQSKLDLHTIHFLCRREDWKHCRTRIRWIFWHISMILCAMVWNFPAVLSATITWRLWKRRLRLRGIVRKRWSQNLAHFIRHSNLGHRLTQAWRLVLTEC